MYTFCVKCIISFKIKCDTFFYIMILKQHTAHFGPTPAQFNKLDQYWLTFHRMDQVMAMK